MFLFLRVLRVNLKVDPQSIEAFLAVVLNRLYTTDANDKVKDLKHANVIAIVGAVGYCLKDFPNVLETARGGLLQRFCSPPSSLDYSIVEQLTNIALTEKVDRLRPRSHECGAS